MVVRLIAATIAGGVVYFFGGFLLFGLLLGPNLMQPNMIEYAGLMKTEPSLVPLILMSLTFPFMLTFIFERWASIKTFATGAMAGAIILFLTTLFFGFSMYAFFNLYKNFTPMLADLGGSIILGLVVGGVVGMVLGMMNKEAAG